MYSATTRGFYRADIHVVIPDDAVEITDDYHAELIDCQNKGMEIAPNEDGYPIARIPQPLPIEERRKYMTVSRAQAKMNLAAIGLLETVIEKINTLPVTHSLRILWEDSPVFHRLNLVLIDFCVKELGLTDEQIDQLFSVQQ